METLTYEQIISAMGGENRLRSMVDGMCFIQSKGYARFSFCRGWVEITDQKHGDNTLKMVIEFNNGKTEVITDVWQNELKSVFEEMTGLYLSI